MSLLKSRSPINISALTIKLKEMALNTPDDRRREATKLILNEISDNKRKRPVASGNSFNQKTGAVRSLFNDKPTSTKKIH